LSVALRFANKRVIEAVDYDDPVARARPWLSNIELDPTERAQLLEIFSRFDPSLSEADVCGGTYDTLARYNGMPECPIEWWDVIDDATERIAHRVWVYAADCGMVYEGTTTVHTGPINRSAFYGEGWEGDVGPGSLAERLEAAQKAMGKAGPGSELAGVAFVNRPVPAPRARAASSRSPAAKKPRKAPRRRRSK
jgi:hypothetical protein